jgi:plastocyanin
MLTAGFLETVRKYGRLAMAALAVAAPPAAVGGEFTLRVVSATGEALDGAVVELRPLDGPSPIAAAPIDTVMDQVDLAFSPELVVVPVGSRVAFPNSDSVSHQVYSFSTAKRFQLPLYRGKPYPPVQFDTPGLVTVGCNIHDSMRGFVFVTDAPWFGKTNYSGAWIGRDLPEGRYEARIWHPRFKNSARFLSESFSIGGGSSRSERSVRLRDALRPPRPAPKRGRENY